MYYSKISSPDVANGPGCRTALFVSGCTHHCKGCFNEETWDFKNGEPFTEDTIKQIIDSLKPAYIDGLTILGGEPMEVVNQPEVLKLVERVRGEVPTANIWIYSGYTFEELTDESNSRCHSENTMKILKQIDVLVDGEFVLDQKDIMLRFRGSRNQRVIDVSATLRGDTIVLSPYGERDGR